MATVAVAMEGERLTPREQFTADSESTATRIEVKLVYVRFISDIQTVEQTFRIAVGLDLEWEATQKDLDEWAQGPEAQKTFMPEIVPNFEIANAKEISIERRQQANGNPFKVNEETGKCFMRAFIEALCLQVYSLRNFPFDIQDLVVNIGMTFNGKEKMMFVPNPVAGSSVLIFNRRYSAIPEFEFRRALTKFETTETWSRMELRCQVARRPEGPMYRVAFPCFLLTLVTITSFGFDLDLEFSERIAYLVTLVLTFVAFAFTISQQLPNVPYLTLLDKYNMSSFTMVVILLAVMSLLRNLPLTAARRNELDDILFYVFLGLLVVMNGYFGLSSIWARRRELLKLRYNTEKLGETTFRQDKDGPLIAKPEDALPDCDRIPKGDAFKSYITLSSKDARDLF